MAMQLATVDNFQPYLTNNFNLKQIMNILVF